MGGMEDIGRGKQSVAGPPSIGGRPDVGGSRIIAAQIIMEPHFADRESLLDSLSFQSESGAAGTYQTSPHPPPRR
ncbi:MAG TPA: hypothetical protein VMA33_05655 [Candidatus Tectomicrobia bacterium]|nr:hypothetical protein [Candidatus Tectomicrobia bacterium]